MPRKSFDASVLGEFFWNSTDLLSILGSDGTWKIVTRRGPSTWAGPSKTCRVALH